MTRKLFFDPKKGHTTTDILTLNINILNSSNTIDLLPHFEPIFRSFFILILKSQRSNYCDRTNKMLFTQRSQSICFNIGYDYSKIKLYQVFALGLG